MGLYIHIDFKIDFGGIKSLHEGTDIYSSEMNDHAIDLMSALIDRFIKKIEKCLFTILNRVSLA